ncbi:hypothetical protein CONCODRAFT_76828 [Conidiobolus coronatus NRRL 28638]|uniref:Uncharacterized protein n=1 Tax=Conidiobolus coronatus (strain ATCC 28846 / CBS 209.66 / NRRL 28638) TaxID=796925 RepID=A0A137PI06_CONC2|nr:hypothetical protein CONCODRAFT_76828 [Conidiobolus coronatus NRRL 28638]|eukprot:KXN74619.1 hypothetical protein CONCODRAFT_76828 [Conidiobolus coronatus NRRL 28638]
MKVPQIHLFEKHQASKPNTVENAPSTSQVTSPVGSPRQSMETHHTHSNEHKQEHLPYQLMSMIR